MKVSQLFVQTLREAPGDAKLKSHALLLRGGYVKSLSSGVFSLFPMGTRVIRKIEALLRTEMDAIGGQEMELPLVHPKELWEETKRYSSIGSELLRFKDRSDHELVLAMTHEEAVTDLVRGTLNSYKQLPFMLYQLRIKFRDEARARGGLIRVKEFTMKDAYSFHKDEADLDRYYEQAYQAYVNVFNKVDIKPIVVQSDSGIMGGKVAHEFMLENADGEDYLIICRDCGYQANAEIADFKRTIFEVEEHLELEEVST
ncbi:proline--tRNA ligase, partial [Fibrobacterales bacterium]|nr:proline--tRNA ligase [Fibrobacterales bacterium]